PAHSYHSTMPSPPARRDIRPKVSSPLDRGGSPGPLRKDRADGGSRVDYSPPGVRAHSTKSSGGNLARGLGLGGVLEDGPFPRRPGRLGGPGGPPPPVPPVQQDHLPRADHGHRQQHAGEAEHG